MSSNLLNEAERVMVICNACRYCEGFCAVFPAMELRRTFTGGDLTYLSHLCHNCRDCYYACQYAPPHDFAVNVPRALGDLRLQTYGEFSWPAAMANLFRCNGLAVSLIAALSVCAVFLLVLLWRGEALLFSPHVGANAFYAVVPYLAMVLPFSALGLFILVSLLKGLGNLCRAMGSPPSELFSLRGNVRALGDALRLKYLEGGGHGCNYPDERFSMIRRWFHHFVFYGFMLCLAATTVAAIYDHLLHRPAPYPLLSWPVALGTTGGAALLIGTAGLLYLKQRMDVTPTPAEALGMDVAFLALLFLTSLSGLLLLILRQTPAMGTLLVLHLGFVLGLFLALPYGKFVHAGYRYVALVRNAIEQARESA